MAVKSQVALRIIPVWFNTLITSLYLIFGLRVISSLSRVGALKSNLKFYAGTDAFAGIVRNNGTLADAISSAFADRVGSTQANRQEFLDGGAQTLGNARTTRVLGVDVLEVPYYPAGYVDLTFPQNRVWGFQRDITVNREYKPKKDTIEYTVFVRFGIQWEELDAVAYVDSDSADS